MMITTIDEAQEAQKELERSIRNFLRKRGWTYHCDNPAICWCWNKTLPDGRRIMVWHDDLALKIEERISEHSSSDSGTPA